MQDTSTSVSETSHRLGVSTQGRGSCGVARTFVWALLAIALLQAAWILCLPPFAGPDEQDHAFKAAAVAHGDFAREHRPSPGGWGEFVRVPRDLAAAAEANCRSLVYVTPDNCRPLAIPGSDLVEIPSSAARYNPVYYAVVGTVARPFAGDAALYAMRLVSSLLCAALVAGALSVARSWGRTRWPALTVVLAATPVVLFSNTVVAPNGIELCSALLLWAALLGVASRTRRGEPLGSLVVVATVGALPLVTLRSLGPLWCVMSVAIVAVLVGLPGIRALVHRRDVRSAAALLLVAAGAAAAWTVTAGTNAVSSDGHNYPGSALGVLPSEYVLWILQSVAAFPFRNEPAPAVVYAAVLALWWTVIAWAARRASVRERVTLLLVVVLGGAVPIAVTVLAYASVGTVWQGRYSLPFVMGLILVCGAILDGHGHGHGRGTRGLAVGVAAVALVTTFASTIAVRDKQRTYTATRLSDHWNGPPAVLVLGLCVAGALMLLVALTWHRGSTAPSGGADHDAEAETQPASNA